MKRILFILPLLLMLGLSTMGRAQVVVGNQEYDIDYLTPKMYEIGGITFSGAENYDTRMILLIAGLQVGDQIRVPGDKLATAVDRLWKQGLFEDVQIYITRIQADKIFFEIELKSRPKLAMFSFEGVKKSDDQKLREEMKIAVGDVVTENFLTTARNKIRAYYLEKGYTNVAVTTQTEKDTITENKEGRVIVKFKVNTGKPVKIDSIIFEGNKDEEHARRELLQEVVLLDCRILEEVEIPGVEIPGGPGKHHHLLQQRGLPRRTHRVGYGLSGEGLPVQNVQAGHVADKDKDFRRQQVCVPQYHIYGQHHLFVRTAFQEFAHQQGRPL